MIFRTINSSFRGAVRSWRAEIHSIDIESIFEESQTALFDLLSREGPVLRIRFVICFHIIFRKVIEEENIDQSFYFCSDAARLRKSCLALVERLQKFKTLSMLLSTMVVAGVYMKCNI
ncbi:c2H2-type domain-containing protein [Trichonephila clavipes]|nr:c2H2-type domain-containing protein [Trichonephila clavipes]